ncbi:hypothetical protein AXF42_Ash016689 [Apostasia shenzhenica]|uniref:F-box domain-containing protein n=1 Tax=Apostasia shenzhenica TaxID=1088818 RepID=A0A2I0AQ05_9ASPA|nr:hypothetical protein AXF42_Ash016689 [Apostasia shenzhenica]
MAIPRCEQSWSSIPDDIALQIASFLEAADVCSLGSCSRFWREICVSDFLWMVLAKRRWQMMDSSASGGSSLFSMVTDGLHEGAAQEVPTEAMLGSKEFYIHKHRSIAHSVSTIIKFVERCTQNESIEVGYYLKAVEDLHSCRLSFKDVQLFLFARRCSVLLNLVGLHYALIWLKILPQEIMEALHNNGVSDREVFVSWFKLGRWFYGFRLHDEHRSHKISLLGLVMNKDDKVLRVLNRGAVHEVIRVYITPVKAKPAESSSLAGTAN